MLVSSVRLQARPGDLSRHGGVFLIDETAAVMRFPVSDYGSHPSLVARSPVYPPIFRRSAFPRWSVLRLHPSWNDTKVCAPIIKLVAVDVIDIQPVSDRKTHQGAMETDGPFDSVHTLNSSCVEATKRPSPSVCPCGIFSVNESDCANAAIPADERDECGQSVVRMLNRSRNSGVPTLARAELVVGTAFARKGSAATQTGKLSGHRPSPVGGVTSPADLTIGAGIRRVNCTPSQETPEQQAAAPAGPEAA